MTWVEGYNTINPLSNPGDTRRWQIPNLDLERARTKKHSHVEPQRLHRRSSQRGKKIQREDLINVWGPASGTTPAPNWLDDETIPDKAIILKMPERSMKTYFIPLPVDLDVPFFPYVADARA